MVSVAHPFEEQPDNFREMARDALEKAGGDTEKAVDILKNHILSDHVLLERNLERIVLRYAQSMMGHISKDRRREAPAMMNIVPIDGSVFNAAVQANFTRYMSRPVWGGKAVGACTAVELRESADRYAKQGRSMIHESKWNHAVAEALENQRKTVEATVADVLDEPSLTILWEAIEYEY